MSRSALSQSAKPWFRLATPCATTRAATEAVVIGAGIAGCSISYALSKLGFSVRLIDAAGIGAAASGNSRAVLRAHVTRNAGLLNQFNEDAFSFTLATLQSLVYQNAAVEYRQLGALQLLNQLGNWPALDTATPVDTATASKLAGIRIDSPALYFPSAAWVNAKSFCQALTTAGNKIVVETGSQVSQLSQQADHWRIHFSDPQQQPVTSPLVILASGAMTTRFEQTAWLDLTLSAGQTTRCRSTGAAVGVRKILTGNSYFIPEESYCSIGSTFWRNCKDPQPCTADDQQNLASMAALSPALKSLLTPVGQWREFRVSTPDRLPIVGAVPDYHYYNAHYADLRHGPRHTTWPQAKYLNGLYILSGFGSRGLSTAAFAAKLLATLISGGESANNTQAYLQLLHPARFLIRRLSRMTEASTSQCKSDSFGRS